MLWNLSPVYCTVTSNQKYMKPSLIQGRAHRKEILPRPIIFTAIMLVHYWSVLVLGLMLESGSTRTVSSQKKQQRNEGGQKTLRGQGVDIDSCALTSCRTNEESRYQSMWPAYTRPL